MQQHDLVVIGSGPGGYVAAIRAAQLGLNTACVESEQALGGTCLRVGCIPSKALLDSSHLYESAQVDFGKRGITVGKLGLDLAGMLRHKDDVVKGLTGGVAGLLRKNKVTRYHGRGRLDGAGRLVVDLASGGTEELAARYVIIATGSTPAALPNIDIDGDFVGSSTEALDFSKVPSQLVVIGGGYIGLEMGTVWRRLGAKVTVLEYLDRLLPASDRETAQVAEKIFRKQGLDIRLGVKVVGVRKDRKGGEVLIEGGEAVRCDRVLMAVGRRPYTSGLGLETVGIETDRRGFIPIDENYRTAANGIYAIGDVVGGAMLAHKAEDEAIACVEKLVTGYGHVNYDAIPSVVYTEPEIAAVGKTEEELKEAGVEYRKGSFPFTANGRAQAIGHTQGRVKILADSHSDRVLGVHIIGPHAGDLIAECAVAMDFGASSEDIARCCHAHPTLAEAVKEAALAVDGRAIHI